MYFKTLKSVIDEHNCVCWYPSCGNDMRPLVMISEQYLSLVSDKFKEPVTMLPDLYIFTDYLKYYEYSEGNYLYDDGKTTIEILSCSSLEKPTREINRESICDFDETDYLKTYGDAVFMRVRVVSENEVGTETWETDIVFVQVENASFAFNYLIPERIKIDYVVRVRYGAGFGGGRLTGDWIHGILTYLDSKYFLTDNPDLKIESSLKEEVEKYYHVPCEFSLPEYEDIYDTDMRAEFVNDGSDWSQSGSVHWLKILK